MKESSNIRHYVIASKRKRVLLIGAREIWSVGAAGCNTPSRELKNQTQNKILKVFLSYTRIKNTHGKSFSECVFDPCTARRAWGCSETEIRVSPLQSRCHQKNVLARQDKFNDCVRALSNVSEDEWQDYFAVIRKRRMKLPGGKNKTDAKTQHAVASQRICLYHR
jgi:hypothetical protein